LQVDAAFFVDGVFQGNGLVVEDVDGFACVQTGVEGVGNLLGAFSGAFATGYALLRINVSRSLPQVHREVAFITFHLLHLGEGQKFYVQVPTALYQLG
jgi:hypothetical protein